MNSIVSRPAGRILKVMFPFVLFLFFIDGCKKDSGPTGPFSPPTYPDLTGHWTGTGSWWDSFTINVTWAADLTKQTDSTFTGTMTDTYTAPSSFAGDALQYSVKGSVTLSGRVTMTETSRVVVKWSRDAMYLPALKTYSSCNVCTTRDTISYSGPGPQPSTTPETFVLVRQK